jgi:hypothetical protein
MGFFLEWRKYLKKGCYFMTNCNAISEGTAMINFQWYYPSEKKNNFFGEAPWSSSEQRGL